MKTIFTNLKTDAASAAPRERAMTLVEMIVTMAIFSVVVLALLYNQLFIMRFDELVCSKLGASDMSRLTFDTMTSEIRATKIWSIGNGSATSFTPIPNGTAQQGNALQLWQTTATNSYIRYFFDTTRAYLCRMTNGGSYTIVAKNLTNTMYFCAEDFSGTNTVTDLQYKYVIHINMQFCQFQYPLTRIGPGYYYDFYKMEFRISPHCPDGA